MSAYPTFFTLRDSTLVTDSGVEPVRATNGALRTRRLWTVDKASIEIGHLLTVTERNTLEAFYAAEKDNNVTYTWPKTGAAYTVRFAAPPRYIPRGNRFEARVRLLEV